MDLSKEYRIEGEAMDGIWKNILRYYIFEGFVSATPMISQASEVAHSNPELDNKTYIFLYFNQTLQGYNYN